MHLDLNEIVSQVFQGRCQEKQMFQTPLVAYSLPNHLDLLVDNRFSLFTNIRYPETFSTIREEFSPLTH